jgi:5-methylcytosine-specific restriction endonuclease McrA
MPKRLVPAKLKRAVIERAQGCCEYCRSQASFAMQSFSIEHIKPHKAGGKTVFANLALACEGCNSHKHAKTKVFDPITGKAISLFHPRRQKWKCFYAD